MKNKFKMAFRNPSLILKSIQNRLLQIYKLYIIKDEPSIYAKKWFKDEGDTLLRLNYPLTSDSVVFDLGGYQGDFAADIFKKYKCNVYIYEPVKSFYLDCVDRFSGNEKIRCFQYGLSNADGTFLISINNDASSLIRNTNIENCEQVLVKSFSDELLTLGISNIDLLKINIEGPEFLILPDILTKKLMPKIRHLQVQFHTFYPNAITLRDEIRSKLQETHYEEWNYPFVWESWARKSDKK